MAGTEMTVASDQSNTTLLDSSMAGLGMETSTAADVQPAGREFITIHLSKLEIILIGVIVGGAVLVAVGVSIWCCCRKRREKPNKSLMRREHQPLCAVDSGAISVSVNRVSEVPLVLRQTSGPTPHGTPHGTPRVSRVSTLRDSPRVVSVQRTGSRASNMAREEQRASRVVARRSPQPIRCSTMDGRDGFTLSSSFEGGLDMVGGSQYDNLDRPTSLYNKGSTYDNLDRSSYDNLNEPTVNLDRKGSTYENVDDNGTGPTCDIIAVHRGPQQGGAGPRRTSTYQKRKGSRTLPLSFNFLNAAKYSKANQDDDGEPDYANVPSQAERLSSGNPDPQGNAPTVPAKTKKYKARRGSKTLELFINRKVPPVLTKIQRQVLEAVPIFGEPTPGTTPKSGAPDGVIQFPPPPGDTPPATSPILSYVNPMYSPTTATPGTAGSSGAYFSV